MHRRAKSLVGSAAIPFDRLFRILTDPGPLGEAPAELVLSRGVAMASVFTSKAGWIFGCRSWLSSSSASSPSRLAKC